MTFPFANPPPIGVGTIEPQTEAFVKMWQNATPAQQTMLGEAHQHYEREIQRFIDEGHNGPSIAASVHAMIDASVKQTLKTPNGQKVQCKRGCAGCCSLHISATREEAALLLVYTEAKGIALDWQKVERQATWNLAEWNEASAAERRCVFLGADNACRVYEHRPSACRKYLVMSAAKYCDTVRFPGHEVAILAPFEGEIVASASLAVLASGSLTRMLLEARRDGTA